MSELTKALAQLGSEPEELIRYLLGAQVNLAYALRVALTRKMGREKATPLIASVWGERARMTAERYVSEVGTKEGLLSLGKITRLWWNREFLCPMDFVEHTEDRIVCQVSVCPYWEAVLNLFGDEARKYYNKETMTLTSIEELQGIRRAAGMDDAVDVECPKIMCGGDDVCQFVFTCRK